MLFVRSLDFKQLPITSEENLSRLVEQECLVDNLESTNVDFVAMMC